MKWLFLVHQVQTPNSRERVKVWRLIKKTGAVLHRNSVYVLPYNKERLEDFQWVCQQIQDSKGEASVFISEAQDREEDIQIKGLFNRAREQEFSELIASAQILLDRVLLAKKQNRMTTALIKTFAKEENDLLQLLEDVKKRNFFGGSRPELIGVFKHLRKHLDASQPVASAPLLRYHRKDFQNKTWTTRKHIHIDRVCSAWLILRFIDPKACFVFAGENELPANAIAFDVLGAEFSHHGENCTFETLAKSFQIQDPAIRIIGEIIHDVDLKDHKFGRSEGSGLDVTIRALAASAANDHETLRIGSILLDALYKYYSKKSATTR